LCIKKRCGLLAHSAFAVCLIIVKAGLFVNSKISRKMTKEKRVVRCMYYAVFAMVLSSIDNDKKSIMLKTYEKT